MNHLTSLADLAKYPGTHDKDRYARKVRRELRRALEAIEAPDTPHGLVLEGCLRLTDRTEPIETTRRRLWLTLDLHSLLTGTRWYTEEDFETELKRRGIVDESGDLV